MRHKILFAMTVLLVVLSCFSPAHASSGSVYDIYLYLDLEQCFLPGYICIPEGCGCYGILGCFDLVCHNYPAAFVETSLVPGQSQVPIIGELISALVAAGSKENGGGGSSQDGNTHLKYYEAHVFSYKTASYIRERYPMLRVCSDDSESSQLNYLSELDASWRTGAADYLTMSYIFSQLAAVAGICDKAAKGGGLGGGMGLSDLCMGTWGPTYPRTGFTNANSKAVASASDAYRALRVTSKSTGRTVLNQKNLDVKGKLQIGAPKGFRGKPSNCIAPGTTPIAWDNRTIQPTAEKDGYVWVWWQQKCCCKKTSACMGD